MSGSSSPDYKALFLKAEERRKWAEERQKQAEDREKQAEEERKLAEELQRQEAELRKQAEEREWQERERNRPTTFPEFIRYYYNLLWRPLRAQTLSRSTTGKIPSPTGKHCPLRLLPWTDCKAKQQEIYNSDAQQLFTPLVDLETYKRLAVEDYIHNIVAELCKIPGTREEFCLDDRIDASQLSTTNPLKPDQFCIHRVDRTMSTLLTTVEYKPPYKLSVAILQRDTVPTEEPQKSRYNTARLAGSAIIQEFHVMIQEGLTYSYLTNGLIDVQLWVPYDDPTTLYYHLGDPSMCGRPGSPMTRIERTLCLCLMSFRTPLRDQAWRNAAEDELPKWRTSFDSEHSHIPSTALPQNPNVDYATFEYSSPEQTTSEYLPSSSPTGSPVTKGRRVLTRAGSGCAPLTQQNVREDSPDSEVDRTASVGRKRGFSQVTSSPTTKQSALQTSPQGNQSGQSRTLVAQYYTQKCLVGLQQGGMLDPDCPNRELHMLSGNKDRHPISTADLIIKLKEQLDQDLDHNYTPIGSCGSYGAPFIITYATFGYTVVGKETTSRLWAEVSREAEVYRILQRAQGSAVPVFLSAINLAQIYFLHGAGKIRHILLMGWGGISMSHITRDKAIQHAISQSVKEIRSLGICYQDLRPENILWNAELKRALIIDFHQSTLERRPKHKQPVLLKRLQCGSEERESKRLRVV
ncbi:hypothetical protein BO71DRAFT_415543 [Aspergillus ellipticus CBS 707.79]|uniref:Protein kinase domain-containing protein n=1 Tax=Aspergillus ellipticus CBS 707.79 TaxID=1448320 RepID=A0A319DSS6_9EURO|nr:hypothetical protein BO71DRAFT_415543 [Aspergillus ellipticus CBS 707.79]